MDTNQGRRIHRPPEDKALLVGAVKSGTPLGEAAKLFGFPQSTASRILDRWENHATLEDLPRSGRPTKMTEAGKRYLDRTARKNRRKPFKEIGNMVQPNISETTVRNYLAQHGYHRYKARKVPYLTKDHKKARRKWARLYRGKDMEFWKRSIFSDECYVYLGDKKGTVFVTRKPGEEYEEDCLVPTFQQSSIRVMVWGCIGLGWKGPLVVLEYPGGRGGGMTAARYQEQVLEVHLKDIYYDLERDLGDIRFQHDGAASHRAKSTEAWLKQHGITLLFHPASSPDLNPIERIWYELKKTLRHRTHPPTSLHELKAAIHEAWAQIPQATIDKHIHCMPDRVRAIINAKGGHTKY
jgi:transposase